MKLKLFILFLFLCALKTQAQHQIRIYHVYRQEVISQDTTISDVEYDLYKEDGDFYICEDDKRYRVRITNEYKDYLEVICCGFICKLYFKL